MVRELRKGKSHTGLVLANGGVVSYQYVVCLSSKPRASPYPEKNPLPDALDDVPVPDFEMEVEGEAVIEVGFSVHLKGWY